MRGDAGDQRTSWIVIESTSKAFRRPDRGEPKPGERNRMARDARRSEDLGHDRGCGPNEWLEEGFVGLAVSSETRGRRRHRAMDDRRGSVVEGLCERDVGMDGFDAELGEIETLEER